MIAKRELPISAGGGMVSAFCANQMKKTIILGYGNALRGDDAAGVLVVEKVRNELENRADPRIKGDSLSIKTVPYLDVAFAEEFAGYSSIILVDAVLDNSEYVRVIDLTSVADNPTLSSHNSSPLVLAELLSTIYQRHPRFYLIAVSGESDSFGEGLSPRAQRSVEKAVWEVMRIIDEICPL